MEAAWDTKEDKSGNLYTSVRGRHMDEEGVTNKEAGECAVPSSQTYAWGEANRPCPHTKAYESDKMGITVMKRWF